MVSSLLVSVVMVLAILGGLAFMYMRFSNVKSTAQGVKLIGEFLIFVFYFVVVIMLGWGFISG